MLLISTLLDIYGLLCICITLFVHSIYFSLTLCQSCLEIYLILYLIMHIVSKILSEAVRLHRMLTRMRLLSSRKVSKQSVSYKKLLFRITEQGGYNWFHIRKHQLHEDISSTDINPPYKIIHLCICFYLCVINISTYIILLL